VFFIRSLKDRRKEGSKNFEIRGPILNSEVQDSSRASTSIRGFLLGSGLKKMKLSTDDTDNADI